MDLFEKCVGKPRSDLILMLRGSRGSKDELGIESHAELKEGLGMFVDKFILKNTPDFIVGQDLEKILEMASTARGFLLR
jgi:hypothetical protein